MSTLTLETLSTSITESDILGWSEEVPLPFRLARWWTKRGPRGKGFVPRFAGRHFCRATRTLIHTEHGAKLAVYPGSLDVYSYIWAHGGTYEPQVVDACQRLLRAGEAAFDIGANVGLVSLELSARFRGQLRLASIEPQPQLARHIAISAKLNAFEKLEVFNCLLSDDEGEQDLYIPAHSIHASVVTRSANAERITCLAVRLDDLVEQRRIPPPTLIKVDVEGAERTVLGGAKRLLAEHQPSVVFESDNNMERFGYSRRDLFARLSKDVAYRFFAIPHDRSGFIRIADGADPNTLPYSNYAAVAERYWDRVQSGLSSEGM
jgi:FkbM family methyltransferase